MKTAAAANSKGEVRDTTEPVLDQTQEMFRAMADAIPNIAWSADASGRTDYLNARGYEYMGLTPEQALGERGFLAGVHPDDVAGTTEAQQFSIKTGRTFEREYRIRRGSDGSFRWHLCRCVPVRNAEGKVVRWFGTSTDIEEMKQAQAHAAEQEAWFRMLFDSIPLSAALINPSTMEFLQFNDAAAKNLGYTREEFAHLTVSDIEAAYPAPQIHKMVAERFSEGDLVVLETKHRMKSGEVRDVVVNYRIMNVNGHWVSNCVWADVTDKKVAEATLLQSEKLASVGRMAATVAHEINNPLEVVTNCIYLAKTSPDLAPELKGYLEMAERELHRVAHIAKRTLGFYRENKHPAMVDIRALVDEVAELYDSKFARQNIVLKIEHGEQCAELMANAGEIRQVISNLITNAFDASLPNQTVRVRTSRVTWNDGSYARITVGDKGKGISATNLKHIFEPFFTTKEAVGNGLGLWVSRKIIEKHNGSIRVRSVEGSGTVFSILLPCSSSGIQI